MVVREAKVVQIRNTNIETLILYSYIYIYIYIFILELKFLSIMPGYLALAMCGIGQRKTSFLWRWVDCILILGI